MVTIRRLIVISALGLIHLSSGLHGAMNLTRLNNEVSLKPSYHPGTWLQLSVLGEGGIGNRSYNEDGNCVNILQVLTPNQNAIAMLKGFPQCSPITELLNRICATDNGVRGHLVPSAELKLDYTLSWGARYFFTENLSFQVYLPFYSIRLNNVSWCDLTKDITQCDIDVKENITDKIYEIAKDYGCGLDLGGWHRQGIGDLSLQIEWMQDFKQEKPFLKNICLGCRSSLNLPTGLKKDEDKIAALPFGNDGAVGIMLGGTLIATLGDYIRTGFDIRLEYIFGNERIRRIKTYPDQTSLLLLQKAVVYREWGIIQQFNLFIDLINFYKGFSGKVDYQYLKHGEDSISIASNTFSTTIANNGGNLNDWTVHSIVAKVGYDFGYHLNECAPVIPQVWIYGKTPVNGSRSTMFISAGAILSVEF